MLRDLFVWPTIQIESGGNANEEIDVLRDSRLGEALQEQGLEHCSVIWSFGDQGEDEVHKLKCPHSIVTNPLGDFVVLDGTTIKVFDSCGKFGYSLCLPRDCKFQCHTVNADTDLEGNLYLLVWKTYKGHERNMEQFFEVFVYDKNGKFNNKFSLRNETKGRKLAVNSHDDHTEVLVLEEERGLHAMVGVYRNETENASYRQFGKRILQDAKDIVGATDGRSLVLDESRRCKTKRCVRVFSAEREQIHIFDVFPDSVAIAFHRASENVVIISPGSQRTRTAVVYK